MDDYYNLLELQRYCADKSLIRKKYREQIQRFHPDSQKVSEDIARQMTQLLNEGYSVLSDDNKRREYDIRLRNFYTEKEQSKKKTQEQRSSEGERKSYSTDNRSANSTSSYRSTNNDFSYDILRTVGTLSSNRSGWTKEINIVSWNGRQGKYDIRDWAPNHEKMGKGVTLTEDEARKLYQLLKSILR